jgi:hypothetical protein
VSRVEVKNRNVLTNRLLDLGWNVYLPVLDEGIDLIAHREDTYETRLVQLKSRWTIARKYLNRQIWIAFPDGADWFMVPHDTMVAWEETAHRLKTVSWLRDGLYTQGHLSQRMRARCVAYRIS